MMLGTSSATFLGILTGDWTCSRSSRVLQISSSTHCTRWSYCDINNQPVNEGICYGHCRCRIHSALGNILLPTILINLLIIHLDASGILSCYKLVHPLNFWVLFLTLTLLMCVQLYRHVSFRLCSSPVVPKILQREVRKSILITQKLLMIYFFFLFCT